MLPDVWSLTWEDAKAVDVPVVGGWGHLEASLPTSDCVMLVVVWNLSWAVSPNTYIWSLHLPSVGFLKLACSWDARESVQEGKAQGMLFLQSSLRSYTASGLP